MSPDELTRLCKSLEAFETPEWAARAILTKELLTGTVIDPCVGKGVLAFEAMRAGYHTVTIDQIDWTKKFPENMSVMPPDILANFLLLSRTSPQFAYQQDKDFSFFMNPPFSQAGQFIDHALHAFGARKIVCFQRWAWRECQERRQWWRDNPPARIWLCGDRATCWRFDLIDDCGRKRGEDKCKNCRTCMTGSPTAHAFFVWERGHKGAEIVHDIWKEDAGNV